MRRDGAFLPDQGTEFWAGASWIIVNVAPRCVVGFQ